ncbi:MAG: hypothetical protein Q8L48_29925 [Archangium sp.]|nr:hypothetical protein [Archangium sp.]
MRTHSLVVLLLGVATPAFATPQLLEPGSIQFADYHPAAPVASPPYRPVPLAPAVHHARFDFFLLGLGLAAGGLVLGAGGFAVLYACREGTGCYGDVTTVIGWALAAPGIIPLTIGLIMMYGASGGRGGRVDAPASTTQRWAVGLAPLRDGALFSAAARF